MPPTSTGPRDLAPIQYGNPELTTAEAMYACGPIAAVAFARANGRNPTLREAMNLAYKVGLTAEGMGGPGNQLKLLQRMGVPASLEWRVDPQKVIADVTGGNPVTISTGAHYFVLSGYDPASGRFYVGSTGSNAIKNGSAWLSIGEMDAISRRITRQYGTEVGVQAALYLDNPTSPVPSVAAAEAPAGGRVGGADRGPSAGGGGLPPDGPDGGDGQGERDQPQTTSGGTAPRGNGMDPKEYVKDPKAVEKSEDIPAYYEPSTGRFSLRPTATSGAQVIVTKVTLRDGTVEVWQRGTQDSPARGVKLFEERDEAQEKRWDEAKKEAAKQTPTAPQQAAGDRRIPPRPTASDPSLLQQYHAALNQLFLDQSITDPLLIKRITDEMNWANQQLTALDKAKDPTGLPVEPATNDIPTWERYLQAVDAIAKTPGNPAPQKIAAEAAANKAAGKIRDLREAEVKAKEAASKKGTPGTEEVVNGIPIGVYRQDGNFHNYSEPEMRARVRALVAAGSLPAGAASTWLSDGSTPARPSLQEIDGSWYAWDGQRLSLVRAGTPKPPTVVKDEAGNSLIWDQAQGRFVPAPGMSGAVPAVTLLTPDYVSENRVVLVTNPDGSFEMKEVPNPQRVTVDVNLLQLKADVKDALLKRYPDGNIPKQVYDTVAAEAARALQEMQQAETVRHNQATEAQNAATLASTQRGQDMQAQSSRYTSDVSAQNQAVSALQSLTNEGFEAWQAAENRAVPAGTAEYHAALRSGELDAKAPAARKKINPSLGMGQASWQAVEMLRNYAPSAARFLTSDPGSGLMLPPTVDVGSFTSPPAAQPGMSLVLMRPPAPEAAPATPTPTPAPAPAPPAETLAAASVAPPAAVGPAAVSPPPPTAAPAQMPVAVRPDGQTGFTSPAMLPDPAHRAGEQSPYGTVAQMPDPTHRAGEQLPYAHAGFTAPPAGQSGLSYVAMSPTMTPEQIAALQQAGLTARQAAQRGWGGPGFTSPATLPVA